MIVSGHQPEYLPYFGFLCKVIHADVFVLVDHVQFLEKAFQNRNYIRSATDRILLTVPVVTKGRWRQSIRDVEIHNQIGWARRHWKSISLNYRKAPFFEAHGERLEALYDRPWRWLVDLDAALISLVMDGLGIKKKVLFSSELGVTGHKTDLLLDICRAVGAHTYLSGAGARVYVDEAKFGEAGLAHEFVELRPPVYRQCHPGFVPNLAGIDLLFNCGPAAHDVIAAARVEPVTT